MALRQSLSAFQNAYLSRSLSRLFDPVNIMFSGNGTVPSSEECDSLIKTMLRFDWSKNVHVSLALNDWLFCSELVVSLVDVKLCHLVTKNVTKTIQMMAVKSEQLIVSDGEASQVIGIAILPLNLIDQDGYYPSERLWVRSFPLSQHASDQLLLADAKYS